MGSSDLDDLLGEQQAYYRAVAPEYDEAARRDLNALDRPEIEAALARFDPSGDVLELAGGTGNWSLSLVRYADRLTVLDGSGEALAINRAKLADTRIPVEHLMVDLFEWRPPRRYDVVFFSFWLSQVPPARFDQFWRLVETALLPDGRVFFVDSASARSEPHDHVLDSEGGLSRRQVQGRQYRVVKIFWEPAALEARLAEVGFDVAVTTCRNGHCIYGLGGASAGLGPGAAHPAA